MDYELHTPWITDEFNDLRYALDANYSEDLSLSNIEGVAAMVPGMNDEYNWFWVVKLTGKEAPWALLDAWCDYTGWGCQDGCTVYYANTAEEAASFAEPNSFDNRNVEVALRDQLRGLMPYGSTFIEAEGLQ